MRSASSAPPLVAAGPWVVPDWLGPQDHAWLAVLLAEHRRFVGRACRELTARLGEPLPCFAPARKVPFARAALAGVFRGETRAAIPSARAREHAFTRGASATARATAIATAARELGIAATELEAALFADLPGERLVVANGEPSLQELVLRANLLLAQSILHKALMVTLVLEGRSRPVIRQARLRGLLCTVLVNEPETRVEISGPLSVLRRTLLYGRWLAELVPFLQQTSRFTLDARCLVRDRERVVRIASGDPIFPSYPARERGSRVELRFVREFERAAPEWDVIVEPEPVRAGGTLIFPDFLLRHRTVPDREWLLEIVGFWTAEYLQKKLAGLRAAAIPNLLLCIDEERRCTSTDMPKHAVVIPFRRRVDVAAVLARIGLEAGERPRSAHGKDHPQGQPRHDRR